MVSAWEDAEYARIRHNQFTSCVSNSLGFSIISRHKIGSLLIDIDVWRVMFGTTGSLIYLAIIK